MTETKKRFGKYYLLDLLAQGGMAEIYRARLASTDVAGRLLVIKKIQSSYGENRDFLHMFKSEIKVTLGFNHPNIVQVYDFGEEDHQPYIAMEWVDGRNLRQLINRFAELKKPFPIELAAFIAEQAASGLQYAHNFRDKITGDRLNVVHRDVSPQNIIISFEGNVKVIDFGIAKAATNSEATRAGIIKGKPSYLSPEQISGESLDGRSDIFALGAVLWEALTGKKLFAGENDLAVLKMIESSSTHVKPPSIHNPDIPKELNDIVLRALAKQRERRFSTAEDMARALHKFIYTYFDDFNPTDLAYYAKDLFKNEIVEDRKKIQSLNAEIEVQLALETRGTAATRIGVTPQPKSPATDFSTPEKRSISLNSRLIESSEEQSDSPQSASEVKAQLDKVPPAIRSQSRSGPPPSGTRSSRIELEKSQTQSSQTKPRSLAKPKAQDPPPGRPLPKKSHLRIAALLIFIGALAISPVLGTHRTGILQLFSQNPAQKAPSPATIPSPQASENPSETDRELGGPSITLKLQLSPGGGNPSISLNGKTLPAGQTSIRVRLDTPLDLTVNRPGFKPFESQFVVDSKQATGLKEWVMDLGIEPLHYGFLTLHTTPSANATLIIDGSPWVKRTPLEGEKVPIGPYKISLENEILGMSKIVQVTIEEGKTVILDEQLEMKKTDTKEPRSTPSP